MVPLQRIEQLFQDFNEKHRNNIERLTRIETDLANIKDLLYDNGQPGVITKLENRITALEKSIWRAAGFVAAITLIVNLIFLFSKK